MPFGMHGPANWAHRIPARRNETMYFEIPGSNLRVLGAMHMVPAGTLAAPPWALQAYDWCEALVHEHSNDDAAWMVRADRPLSSVLGGETWRAIEAAIANDRRRAILDGLRPWAAAMHLTVWAQQLELGVESTFLQRLADDGKSLAVLESVADLRTAFDSVPLPEIEKVMAACLRDMPTAQERLLQLHAAWLAGDRAAMYAAAADSPIGASAAMWEAGIARRNRAWGLRLQPLLATNQRTLVMVGALHLCGPGSLEACLGVSFRRVPERG